MGAIVASILVSLIATIGGLYFMYQDKKDLSLIHIYENDADSSPLVKKVLLFLLFMATTKLVA